MCRAEQIIEISFLRECGLGCVLGFSCRARKAQASRFGTKTQLAGRTLTPMPPPGGRLTAELRHKSENAHRRSHLLRCVGHVVPTCAALPADRASVQVCATQTPRPPTVRREENRTINFTWVILFGHSKTNFDSQHGRKEAK